jgi:hypothetical protein
MHLNRAVLAELDPAWPRQETALGLAFRPSRLDPRRRRRRSGSVADWPSARRVSG